MQRFPRYSKQALEEALLDTPVVFLMGARQSGKTTLVKELAQADWRIVNLDNETQLRLVQNDPIGFVQRLGDEPVIIDEVQRLPELLLAIKVSVDENRRPGRFLLTGSANAMLLPQVADSLAGRIEAVLLNPLSECEIKQRKPTLMHKLLANEAPVANEAVDRDDICKRIVTGCFPEPLQRQSESRVQMWYRQYVDFMVQKDMADLSHINQPDTLLQLLKISTYYSAKLVNFTEIAGKVGLTSEAAKKYLSLAEHLFLMKRLPAWHSNEYKRLIKTPKLHLTDTGLICAIRHIDTTLLQNDFNELGPLLETFVVNELQKQANWLPQQLRFSHYRDKDKFEVDCVIELADRSCFGIEVKASATLNKSDFKGLVRLQRIAGSRFKMGVLFYFGDQTLPFGDGLFAVPISALWS